MSQRNSGYARKPDEAYDTPAWVAGVVAPYLRNRGVQHVWEPAPGKGQLVRALRELGYTVLVTCDDFFTLTHRPFADAIVTNPPFGPYGQIAASFIRTALSTSARIIALVLRIDYDSAITRADIFRDCPYFAGKIVLLRRIKWFAGPRTPSDNHAWFIWDKDRPEGEPRIWYQAPWASDACHAILLDLDARMEIEIK